MTELLKFKINEYVEDCCIIVHVTLFFLHIHQHKPGSEDKSSVVTEWYVLCAQNTWNKELWKYKMTKGQKCLFKG